MKREAVIKATSILSKKKVTMVMKKPILAFAVSVLGLTLAVAFGKAKHK